MPEGSSGDDSSQDYGSDGSVDEAHKPQSASDQLRTRPRSTSASSQASGPPRARQRGCFDEDGDESASSSSELDFDDVSDDADEAQDTVRNLRWTKRQSLSTREAARLACEEWGGNVYTYLTRYKTSSIICRIYQCRTHVACGHRVTIAGLVYGFECELFDAGEHSSRAIPTIRRGLHPALRKEAESLLRIGCGAAKARLMLSKQFTDQPKVVASLPSTRQLQNRKAYMMRTTLGGWEIKNFADFNGWAMTDADDPAMDDLVILDTFIHRGGDDEASFGVIVTSRRLFRNVVTAVESQGDELVCATDGTYKLHFGGWTVVDCGTEAVTWASESFVHRFIPWVYMFVRSETTEAYQSMFRTIRHYAQLFFDVDVRVKFASLDHSKAIASAFLLEWSRVTLLTCWPHLVRQSRRKAALLSSLGVYDNMIKPHLHLLRSARTHAQFIAMSVIITAYWIETGERDYADWFRSVYLVKRWEQ